MSHPTEPASIVVLASGRGSNFRALCEAAARGRLPAKIGALVTNVCGVGACDVAREFGVPVIEVPHAGLKRAEHEHKLFDALARLKFDWLVLAGYMRLFTPSFIDRFYDQTRQASRVVNIHPSLLPAFPGVDGYGQALRYGVKYAGATVHLVGAGLDDGPIVAQRVVEVRDDDTEETLRERGLAVEHELYAAALKDLIARPWRIGHGKLEGGRPRVVFEGGKNEHD